MLGFLNPPSNRDPAQSQLFPCLRSRVKGWQLGQVPPPFRALFATSEAPRPSARWLFRLLLHAPATLAQPDPAAHRGHREAEQALCQGGHGTGSVGSGTAKLGWLSHHGLERSWRSPLAGCPPALPIMLGCSLFAAQRHSSHWLSGLVGAVLASRQGDRRCQELLPRP